MHHEDHTSPVAVVTGGAQGIGLATATLLAERGFTVALADLDGALAAQAAGALNSAGYTATASTVDVSQRSDVERLMAEVISVYGRIDVLVNNAGIAGRAAPIVEVTDEEWDALLRMDLTSVFLCCRAVLPHMIGRHRGAIVNVASIAGKEGNPNMVGYSAAKAGVIALTKAVAKEVATSGVRVNAVAPAVIETAILQTLTPEQVGYMTSRIPMGRLGRPDEAAQVIAFLASDASSFVTGQCYDVSGGRATVTERNREQGTGNRNKNRNKEQGTGTGNREQVATLVRRPYLHAKTHTANARYSVRRVPARAPSPSPSPRTRGEGNRFRVVEAILQRSAPLTLPLSPPAHSLPPLPACGERVGVRGQGRAASNLAKAPRNVPCSLFLVPCSLFPVPCSPVPCYLLLVTSSAPPAASPARSRRCRSRRQKPPPPGY